MQLGARWETMQLRMPIFTYDVTDPDHPIWKIMIYHVGFEYELEDSIDTDNLTYHVIIDAKTGEIIDSYDMTKDTNGYNI